MYSEDKDYKHRYLDDLKYIQKVGIKYGYTLTLNDCDNLWSDYSVKYAAGWLGVEDEGEVLHVIKNKKKDYQELYYQEKKKLLDVKNWIKSELSQLTDNKMDKNSYYDSHYKTIYEKILRKLD